MAVAVPQAAVGGGDGAVPHPTSEEVYRARRDHFAAERDALARRWNAVANARLLAFVLALLLLGVAVRNRAPVAAALAVLLFAGFLALVRRHRLLDRARRRYEELRRINEEAGQRLARRWDALPLRHGARPEPSHPYAADLDLFGRASLFHLLEAVGTGLGEKILTRWLLAPAPPVTVRERQAAVAELAPLIDLRDELQVRGGPPDEGRPDPGPFLAWAEGEPWLGRRPWLRWAARISPALLWAAIVAQVAGFVPYPLWLLPLVVNIVLAQTVVATAHRLIERGASREGDFGRYAPAFALLTGTSFEAPVLRRVQAVLTADGVAAAEWMRRLGRLTSFVLPRSALSYAPIQMLTLWDLHLLAQLERWQEAAGGRARAWLDALGEAEALAALAVLAHDNPDWAFPELDQELPALTARGLGHPLLPREGRVVNDVEVGPVGTFLLVTGSNMSGKSTLLRALGVNLVLAGAGGPVCAAAFRAPPVALWTSMRVQDSLERGVSFFMAELQRLKAVVDAANETRPEAGRRLFYLLDEILQGTNTFERQIAARGVIAHLVARAALGAVSTHDLTLAEGPELGALARPIHFTETISSDPEGAAMSFDYRSRPGIARSTNALRLMEIVGLPTDDAPIPRP